MNPRDVWVKALDPRTGRYYYANKLTQTTQWNPPEDFAEDVDITGRHSQEQIETERYDSALSSSFLEKSYNDVSKTISKDSHEKLELPDGWEMMRDSRTDRAFYVDHKNQITQWEHPALNSIGKNESSKNRAPYLQQKIRNAVSSSMVRDSTNDENNFRGISYNSNSSSSSFNSYNQGYKKNNNGSNSSKTGRRQSPPVDFSVLHVKDEARIQCPGCDVYFSAIKRRHHCRLCGDVFCDSCSNNRCLLPLSGPEFQSPVRVCDQCNSDINKGNYFSMRRYLPALQLFDPSKPLPTAGTTETKSLKNIFNLDSEKIDSESSSEYSGVTEEQVCAAISSLISDLDDVLMDATSFHEKVTIPANILIPAISRHLNYSGTSDRAIHALSTLLALGKIVGDDSFAVAVFEKSSSENGETSEKDINIINSIHKLLELHDSSDHTLFIQEQAARAISFLSDSETLSNIDLLETYKLIDVWRSLRNLLDHVTSSKNADLQRWAAASIRNLIQLGMMHSLDSDDASSAGSRKPFIKQLVEIGGVATLCCLLEAEDGDTRAYAIGALSSTIDATRDAGEAGCDADLILGIANTGACGSAVSHLLLSSDVNVAQTSISFASKVVYPLLGFFRPAVFPMSGDDSGVSDLIVPYCEAALALANDGESIPALLQLLSPSHSFHSHSRSSEQIHLRLHSMITLCAILIACNSHPYKNASARKSILSVSKKLVSLATLPTAFEVLNDTSSQSLNSARDTPESQLREAAGICIAEILQLDETNESLTYLCESKAVNLFFALAGDDGMLKSGELQGGLVPRSLPWVECAALILNKVWYRGQSVLCKTSISDSDIEGSNNSTETNHNNHKGFDSGTIGCLLQAIDGGCVQLLSSLLQHNMNENNTKGEIYLKIAACHAIAAIFGIAHGDHEGIAAVRLYNNMKQCRSSSMNAALIISVFGKVNNGELAILCPILMILRNLPEMMQYYSGNEREFPLYAFTEAICMALGSICGAYVGCEYEKNKFLDASGPPIDFTALVTQEKQLSLVKQRNCSILSHVLFSVKNLLPSMLIGAHGAGAIGPALRIALTIALFGPAESQYHVGNFLIPVCDILREALIAGDNYAFTASIVLVRECGAHVKADAGSLISALRQAIATLSSVLAIGEKTNIREREILKYLKDNVILTFETLSTNPALWDVLAMNAFEGIAEYLDSNTDWQKNELVNRRYLCAAFYTILNTMKLKSHTVAASRAGLGASAAHIICQSHSANTTRIHQKDSRPQENELDYNVQVAALKTLHTLASVKDARNSGLDLIKSGAVKAACFAIGQCIDEFEVTPDTCDFIVKLGLELLHLIIADLELPGEERTTTRASSAESKLFIDQVSGQPEFAKALCSTVLHSWKEAETEFANISFFGSPLISLHGPCGKFSSTTESAISLQFSIAYLCSFYGDNHGENFWSIMMEKEGLETVNYEAQREATVIFCSVFLSILSNEQDGVCVPKTTVQRKYYLNYSLPTVRQLLLDGLYSILSEILDPNNSASDEEEKRSMLVMLNKFRVPQICISICGKSPSLTKSAINLIQELVTCFPDEILPNLINDKSSLQSALSMLSSKLNGDDDESEAQIHQLFSRIICASSTNGVLGPSLEKFGLRSQAILSISHACEAEDDEVQQFCLNSLASIFSFPAISTKDDGRLCLTASEAKTIAKAIGGTLSSIVLERFAARAMEEPDDYLVESNEKSIEQAPEVMLLCMLVSFKEALMEFCKVGGLEAISLVSSEGVSSAIFAMTEVVRDSPSVILEIQGHISIMDVLSTDKMECSTQSQMIKWFHKIKASFEFLTIFCKGSNEGKKAVSEVDSFPLCIQTASEIICSPLEKDSEDITSPTEDENEPERHEEKKEKEEEEEEEPYRKHAIIAAISFLSEMVDTRPCLDFILQDAKLIKALVSFLERSFDLDLILNSTELLKSVSFHTDTNEEFGETEYSQVYFSSTFTNLLGRMDLNVSRKKYPEKLPFFRSSMNQRSLSTTSSNSNTNLIFAKAAEGMESVLDQVDKDKKAKLISDLGNHLMSLLKELAIDLSRKKFNGKSSFSSRNSGMFVCNILTLLLIACNNTHPFGESEDTDDKTPFQDSLISSLFQLIVLYETFEDKCDTDAKTDDSEEELCYWAAARTQSLQFLSYILRNKRLSSSISWNNVMAESESRVSILMKGTALYSDIFQAIDSAVEKKKDMLARVIGSKLRDRLYTLR